jgi:WD40 repeat protein
MRKEAWHGTTSAVQVAVKAQEEGSGRPVEGGPVWWCAPAASFLLLCLLGGLTAAGDPKEAKPSPTQDFERQKQNAYDCLPLVNLDKHLCCAGGPFSRNGRFILTISCREDAIRWWDVRTGELAKIVPFKTPNFFRKSRSLCWNGPEMVVGDREGNVIIYDLERNRARTIPLQLTQDHVDSAFAPDGRVLAIREGKNTAQRKDNPVAPIEWEKSVRIWDTVTKKQITTIPQEGTWTSMELSPDGKLLAINNHKTIRIWDTTNGTKQAELETDAYGGMAFAHGSRILAVVPPQPSTLQLWDVATGKLRKTVKLPSDSRNIVSSPDGSLIAVACADSSIHVVDAAKGTVSFTLRKNTRRCEIFTYGTAFSKDGTLLLSVEHDFNRSTWTPDEVIIWSIKDKKEVSTLREHYPYVGSMRFRSDGRGLVLWNRDLLDPEDRADVQVWDVAARKLKSSTRGPKRAGCLAVLAPDCRTVAESTIGNRIRVWDTASGKAAYVSKPTRRPLNCIALALNGRTLAAGTFNDGQVSLWDIPQTDLTKVRLAKSLDGHTNGVTRLALSPAGNLLATGGSDSSVILRDLKDGSVKHLVESLGGGTHVSAMCFSPDAKLLAWGDSAGCLHQYDASTGKTDGGGLLHDAGITVITYSPDGKLFASASLDRTVNIMETRGKKLILKTLKGHTKGVYQLAFSPDGKTLASASWDGTV